MDTHPGEKEVTLKLLELARLEGGKKIIDLGAGDGKSVFLLREKGFEVTGIDLVNRESLVLNGDMRALGYPGESFDAALAECSFSVCGDLSAAVAESARILKDGGKLLVSDIYYREAVSGPAVFPGAYTIENFKNQMFRHGFQVLFFEDISEVLKAYYLESVWQGENKISRAEAKSLKNLKLGYFMMICIKETTAAKGE